MDASLVGLKKIWFVISGVMLLGSVVAIAVFGLRFGIDFTGGSLLEMHFADRVPVLEEVYRTLDAAGFHEATAQSTGTSNLMVRTENLDEVEHQNLLDALKNQFGAVEELRFDSIGPSIGQELRDRAITGVIVTLVLIGLYVAWAFRKVSEPIASWKYGILTLVTAFHDVIVPLGVFAILGEVLGWQIDSAFVAAILTILGYSINDTIVVFDRTRENLARQTGESFEVIVEKSLKQTIARSIITGISSLLALAAILVWGGDSTRPFAFTLILGILVGTYSSIFIASPLLVVLERTRRHT